MEGAEFISRFEDGKGVVEGVDVLHFELPEDGGCVEGHGRSDSWDYDVDVFEYGAPSPVNDGVRDSDIHIAFCNRDEDHFVATDFALFHNSFI